MVKLACGTGGQCLECGRCFSQVGHARRHYDLVHKQSDLEFGCHICNKTFKHMTYLTHHLRQSHGIYQRDIAQHMREQSNVDH